MKDLVDGEEMRILDQKTIQEAGISSETLMERAALCTVQEILPVLSDKKKILVVCGSGNNGGDGIAIARLLFLKGYPVSYCLVGNPEHQTLSLIKQRGTAEYYQVPESSPEEISHADVLIDAIFGVGLSREISGAYQGLLEEMNRSRAFKIAVDLPSGIDARTGRVLGIAFQADLTVTFAYRKLGLSLYPGRQYAGNVIVADIGIYGSSGQYHTIEPSDLQVLSHRSPSGNKGTFGKVLIFAGSSGMCGAAYFAACSALRMGAGMVQIHTVPENRIPLQTLLPEAMISTSSSEEEQDRLFRWCDVLVAGPGLGSSPDRESLLAWYLTRAHKEHKPMILDADGLNLLSGHPEWRPLLGNHIILTPHMGEMSRLTGLAISELKKDPLRAACGLALQTGAVCVLKDAVTVISDGRQGCYLNLSGNDGMATAGSGDVLSGILGGILSIMRPMDTFSEEFDMKFYAALGVFFHGRCGDIAAAHKGKHALTAGDLLVAIPELFREDIES